MKEDLYKFCQEYIDARISRIQGQITEVKSALTSESKSSAGDKHETGRAMLQLEREKLGQQLLEAEKLEQLLRKVPTNTPNNRVVLGSLVKTASATYYIAISAGKFQKDGAVIFCISANTPIAKLLLGKTTGDTIIFNGIEAKILTIE